MKKTKYKTKPGSKLPDGSYMLRKGKRSIRFIVQNSALWIICNHSDFFYASVGACPIMKCTDPDGKIYLFFRAVDYLNWHKDEEKPIRTFAITHCLTLQPITNDPDQTGIEA